MSVENDLMQKLLISKKIMDKHNGISRNTDPSLSQPVLENFEPVNAKYNIPQEILQESIPTKNYNNETPTEDRIINSKLPEEIKRLMLEYPINQPNSMNGSSVISNELVEKATRLMNVDASGKQTQQTNQTPTNQNIVIENKTQNSLLSDNNLRDILKEVVEEVLSENGLLVESERKSNEVFKFRVGQHIFEGKLTKIKKIS
jgi:hypothetical protein